MSDPTRPAAIDSVLREERVFPPPPAFAHRASISSRARYDELYRRSLDHPETFWADLARERLRWSSPWQRVLDWQPPHAKWFGGGSLNVAHNCVDRHAEGKDADKPATCRIARVLHELGFELLASRGTAAALAAAGLPVTVVNKVHEGRPHIVDLIKDKSVALVVNTSEGAQAIADSYSLRRAALMGRLPYYTTMAGARALVEGLRKLARGSLEVRPLQAYLAALEER